MRNSFKIVLSQAFSDADVNMRESVGHKDYCARVRGWEGRGEAEVGPGDEDRRTSVAVSTRPSQLRLTLTTISQT